MQPLELVSPIFESVDPSTLPCVAAGPELFFSESPGELEAAKRLCRTCPVKSACLAGAIERGEPWGVWGGEVFQFGRPVPYKRPRGRPRKHPLPPVPVPIDVPMEVPAAAKAS